MTSPLTKTAHKSAFDGVSLKSVRVLVGLVTNKSQVEKSLLERRYKEQALDFEKMLLFMTALDVITCSDRYIFRSATLGQIQEALQTSEKRLVEYVMQLTLDSTTRYGTEIRKVLYKFKLERGKFCLRPHDLKHGQYATRNILMEAEAIGLNSEQDEYVVNDWFCQHFVKVRYALGTTPDQLTKINRRKEEIGLAAETAVMKYERQMVGRRDSANVVHIALKNTNAGFDIASLRRNVGTNGSRIRMIEVKAVSPKDWAFTLTKNEIKIAAENTSDYYLYLVPIVGGKPDIANMDVVQDPTDMLVCDNKWKVEKGDWNVCRTVVVRRKADVVAKGIKAKR